jgi:hypothetical protein
MFNVDRVETVRIAWIDKFGISRYGGGAFLIITWLLGLGVDNVRGQGYLQATGSPTFSTKLPVENGYVDASNGRLHLEIPIGTTLPQRGFAHRNNVMMYDSNIWAGGYLSTPWYHTNISNSTGTATSWGGWRIVSPDDFGNIAYSTWQGNYCNGRYPRYITRSNWTYRSQDGTLHSFQGVYTQLDHCGGGTVPNNSGFANDGSGYYLSVINYTEAVVYSPDGTNVGSWDTNGNYYSKDSNGNPVDTLGRTTITTTTNGNVITYGVPNAQGDTSNYLITTSTITANTKFGVPNTTECSSPTCTITVIQSIKLPDNTLYSFKYDCDSTVDSTDCNSPGGQNGYYGLLTSMTLPTGGQIKYSWSLYIDSNGSYYQWISKRVTPDSSTGWTYTPHVVTTCGSGQVNCQQTLTVTKPSGDATVYTFALNGGAWKNQEQTYNGSASSGTLLSTVSECWNFVTITNGVCQYNTTTANPATGVQKLAESVTLPLPSGSTITKTTQYTYDGYGNTTKIQENNYYTGSLPTIADRTISISYLNPTSYINALILNRPTNVTATNASGATIAQTLYTYDGSPIVSKTGVVNHNDTTYGTTNTVRGNVTKIQRLVSGTSNYLSTSMTYDMTGEVMTSSD